MAVNGTKDPVRVFSCVCTVFNGTWAPYDPVSQSRNPDATMMQLTQAEKTRIGSFVPCTPVGGCSTDKLMQTNLGS
jgi:hypothetical protein